MASFTPVVDVPPAPAAITWIRTPEELDQWLAQGEDTPLALDTEFERVSTFYPIPGLVQLGLADQFRLVDPEVAEASRGFRERLANPEAPKLLYAMSEDLELFRQWLGIELKGVLDLQIGAALAGEGFSLGYARAVEHLFGETLDKSATRSDWLARPLSEAQQRYAIEDIRFLQPMYDWLQERLGELGLIHALPEESARFADELASLDDPDLHYLKLRGGWALSPVKQAVLRELVRWREHECQRQDRPRNRVLADALLIAIAERLPDSPEELGDIQGVPSGVVRRYGETLVKLIAKGASGKPVPEVIAAPLTREQQGLFKQLKRVFRKASEASGIPMELLAPRKRLEKMIQDGSLDKQVFFAGWRREILAPFRNEIEELLAS